MREEFLIYFQNEECGLFLRQSVMIGVMFELFKEKFMVESKIDYLKVSEKFQLNIIEPSVNRCLVQSSLHCI